MAITTHALIRELDPDELSEMLHTLPAAYTRWQRQERDRLAALIDRYYFQITGKHLFYDWNL